MKTYIASIVMLTLMLASSVTQAREIMIGLSPYVETAQSTKQVKALLQFMTQALDLENSAIVFDAYHLKALGRFQVPKKQLYRHPKAKLNANRKVVATLLQYAKQARKPQGGTEPAVIGAIRLPQFLRFLGENYTLTKETDILILGAPLYDDPNDKALSMATGLIPSDGHLLASLRNSPYGLKESTKLLKNVRVHWVYLDDGLSRGDSHAFYVKRFWTLYVEQLGGQLATYTSDHATLFSRVKESASAPKHRYRRQYTGKLEMIQLRPPALKSTDSIHERSLANKPISRAALKLTHDIEIGLSWNCLDCDLDLLARPGPKAMPLYYAQTHTPEGTYFKDFTSAPRLSQGLESIRFSKRLNVQALLIAVNFFGGVVKRSVQGELRMSVDGRTYAKTFVMKATRGNSGLGREETLQTGKAANANWLVIDPLAVLGVKNVARVNPVGEKS